jgi:acyl-CoA reductase-like NAD-dependent aldehyde dehydrogenase
MSPSSKKKQRKRTLDLLKQTRSELSVGKQLLREMKNEAKRAKGKLARDNAKRVAKVLDRTVDSLEDHEDILVHELVGIVINERRGIRLRVCER